MYFIAKKMNRKYNTRINKTITKLLSNFLYVEKGNCSNSQYFYNFKNGSATIEYSTLALFIMIRIDSFQQIKK